jgi:hypothetical protein
MHEGQEPMSSECDILGGTCYYDGSGLAADRLIPAFLERGTDAVWEKLTEWYTDRFGDEADQP